MAPPRTVTLPSQTELRVLFRYNAGTGQLFWKKRPRRMFKTADSHKGWNARFADKEALTYIKDGHRRGLLFRNSVYAHRIIWKMMTGEDPSEIDHIDGNGLNNAWDNLRISYGDNQKNAKLRHDNTSGRVGVVRRGDRWIAQIGINGTTKHIGVYDSVVLAIAARMAAEEEHGFSSDHGRKKE